MKPIHIYCCGESTALKYAMEELKAMEYTFSEIPCSNVTHLLIPTPGLENEATIKGGYSLKDVLLSLPQNIKILGGGLGVPLLESYNKIDLLEDPYYLANNAAISAYCALKITMRALPCQISDKRILIIGWGRIGKCLADLLRNIGCNVTIAARKDADRAMISALGYHAIHTQSIAPDSYGVVFNTVPYPLVNQPTSTALLIDLASSPGIISGSALVARGLPSKEAPESSGHLIAQTIDRLLQREAD